MLHAICSRERYGTVPCLRFSSRLSTTRSQVNLRSNTLTLLRLASMVMLLIVAGGVVVGASWLRRTVEPAAFSGRITAEDLGGIEWALDISSMRLRCAPILSDAGLSPSAKAIFAAEERLLRDFLLLHEKAHCLAGDGLNPFLSETDVWHAEAVADIFASSMLIVRHGEAARSFLRKWNLLRTTAWMGGDTFHWTTPALSPFLTTNQTLGNDESEVIRTAQTFVAGQLGKRDLAQPDSARRAFLSAEDGGPQQAENWRASVSRPEFAGIPALEEIRMLRAHLESPDWRRAALAWRSMR